MFSYDQLKELIDLASKKDLGLLEIESDGFRLRIARDSVVSSSGPPGGFSGARSGDAAHGGSTSPSSQAAGPAASSEAQAPAEPEHHVLSSPIVGTFYVAPSPESPPFVEVGDTVKRGQVVCIVEAMKLMNEIEADVDGTIVQVIPENAEPVEFGAPLFAIDPSS